jgi:flagellar assembly factor FliW
MSVTFQSIRFGTVEVPEEDVIEFPLGLIGLGGRHYALIDRNPGTGFLWLHSIEDEALGLPVVNPNLFFPEFTLHLSEEDRERIGFEETSRLSLYVTVRATPNPLDITANLRAPLVVHEGKGYQLINSSMDAPLQAPLFALAERSAGESSRAAAESSHAAGAA